MIITLVQVHFYDTFTRLLARIYSRKRNEKEMCTILQSIIVYLVHKSDSKRKESKYTHNYTHTHTQSLNRLIVCSWLMYIEKYIYIFFVRFVFFSPSTFDLDSFPLFWNLLFCAKVFILIYQHLWSARRQSQTQKRHAHDHTIQFTRIIYIYI